MAPQIVVAMITRWRVTTELRGALRRVRNVGRMSCATRVPTIWWSWGKADGLYIIGLLSCNMCSRLSYHVTVNLKYSQNCIDTFFDIIFFLHSLWTTVLNSASGGSQNSRQSNSQVKAPYLTITSIQNPRNLCRGRRWYPHLSWIQKCHCRLV